MENKYAYFTDDHSALYCNLVVTEKNICSSPD